MLVLAGAGAFVAWPHHRPGLDGGERYGLDVSNHQGEIDWARVAGDGIGFTYVEATEGGDVLDRSFRENWRDADAAGRGPRARRQLRRSPGPGPHRASCTCSWRGSIRGGASLPGPLVGP